MALELRNVLEATLDLQLSATLVWRYPTLDALAGHLAEKLGLALDAPAASEPAQRDDLDRVATQIASLSEAEMEALLLEQIERVSHSE
jgi:hypothetical protein